MHWDIDGMSTLQSLRADEHRSFLGAEFGVEMDGDEPKALNYFNVLADPKLAYLGREVFETMRRQFAADGAAGVTEDEASLQYRLRLEGWADVLEIMLEEVLNDLAKLKPVQSVDQEDLL